MPGNCGPKITSVVIGKSMQMFGPKPKVTATFDDGSTAELFDYFPDEISFTEAELIGLTAAEARALFHRKDVAYLRS